MSDDYKYEFETPSGIQVSMRSMKLKDEDILTDSQLAKEQKTFDVLLNSCVKSDFPLKKMLVGDRLFLLLKLRSISLGSKVDMEVQCKRCGNNFTEELDLDELEIKKLDKSKVEYVDGRYYFNIKLPDSGKSVKMRLLTGDDENRLATIKRDYPDEFMSRLTLLRIAEFDGKKIKNIKEIKELSIKDSVYLREVYDEHDCGVMTDIRTDCPNCFASNEVGLPIDDSNFFLPKTLKID